MWVSRDPRLMTTDLVLKLVNHLLVSKETVCICKLVMCV